jgi:hypothetical protein
MRRTCSTNVEKRNAYRTLVGKPEGIGPLGRQRCRWVNNIVTCCVESELKYPSPSNG